MRVLDAYLRSSKKEERDFVKDLVRKARCIVVGSRGGEILVGPSRFVGYLNNTLLKHQKNLYKDGKETNPAISRALGQQLVEDQTLEEEFSAFCRKQEIHKIAQVRRTYWRVS